MNSFSLNRFGQTLRWVLANNFRSLIAWTVGFAACIFLAEMFILTISSTGAPRKYDDILMNSVADFPTIFILIAILMELSLIFFDYRKKTKREALLMLPATNLEKYLSVLFYATVVWTLGVFVAFVVGDTMRMAARAMIYGNEWISTVPKVLSNLRPDAFKKFYVDPAPVSFKLTEIYFVVSILFLIHSFYVFCGTLLRKYSFVMATLSAVCFTVLLLWLCNDKHLHLFYAIPEDGELVYKVGTLGYVLCVVYPLLTIFFYWASFRIFKGFQLITNKWTNYDILKR